MQGRTIAATAIGAVVGAVMGLLALAFAAARVIEAGVSTQPGPLSFTVGRSAMTLYVLLAGAATGVLFGAIGYATGRLADPRERRYPPGIMLSLAAVTGAAVAYAASRAAVGATASSILDGVVTLPVVRAGAVALVTGLITGAATAATVERLSRPSLYAFGGEAWPVTAAGFMRAAAASIGIPVAAIIVAAVGIIAFSQVLLGVSHLTALILFSAISAVILFGAAAIASRDPRPRD